MPITKLGALVAFLRISHSDDQIGPWFTCVAMSVVIKLPVLNLHAVRERP